MVPWLQLRLLLLIVARKLVQTSTTDRQAENSEVLLPKVMVAVIWSPLAKPDVRPKLHAPKPLTVAVPKNVFPWQGKFNNNYSEFITSFKLSTAALNAISDQSGDPILKQAKSALSQPSWTEGDFEFRVTVLINATNGIGSTITKIFTAKGSDLYTVFYKKVGSSYVVESIYPKEFNPNIELVPWDLQSYSLGWKFIFKRFNKMTH